MRSEAAAAAASMAAGSTATLSAISRWCASVRAKLSNPGLPLTRASTSGGNRSAESAAAAGYRPGGGPGQLGFKLAGRAPSGTPGLAAALVSGAPVARSARAWTHALGSSGSRSPQPCSSE